MRAANTSPMTRAGTPAMSPTRSHRGGAKVISPRIVRSVRAATGSFKPTLPASSSIYSWRMRGSLHHLDGVVAKEERSTPAAALSLAPGSGVKNRSAAIPGASQRGSLAPGKAARTRATAASARAGTQGSQARVAP
jgi:hypothetical protein